MTARLLITDGTTSVSLLGPVFYLSEWRPNISFYKDGGSFADSPLADGRRLVDRRFENVVETFELKSTGYNQDNIIRWSQDLRRLLEQAAEYWAGFGARGPVWIEAKSSQETNTRYALIMAGRIPEDDNPYRQPFLQPDCRAVMDNLTLIIERLHWQECEPETDVCMPLVVRPDLDPEGFAYLDRIKGVAPTSSLVAVWKFNEEAGLVANNYTNYGDLLDGVYNGGIILDDLTFLTGEPSAFVSIVNGVVDVHSTTLENLFESADIGEHGTFVIWIRSSGLIWTDGDEHYILKLWAESGNQITLRKTAADNTIEGLIEADGLTRTVTSASVNGTTDWLSIGFTWNSTTHVMRLYLNGIIRSINFDYRGNFSGPITEAWIGAEESPGGATTPGISSDIAYGILWSQAIEPHDLLPVLNPPRPNFEGTLCEDVYVSNKLANARISHGYYYDASLGTFSTNIVLNDYEVGSTLLLPAAPAAGDFLYFGSSTSTTPPGRTFDSIVLDITNNPEGVSGSWQYWNGAIWTALTTIKDNTASLMNNDVNSVHWSPPTNWTSTTINSVVAYWVRFNVSSVSSPVPPKQQNRAPYTVIRPHVEIPAESVPGDIPTLVGITLEGVASTGISLGNNIPAFRVYGGLRSLSRGYGFTSHINLGDIQNQNGITISVGTDTAFATDNESPTGRAAVYNPGGAEAMVERVNIEIGSNLSADFRGTYRAFLRTRSAGTTTWEVRLRLYVMGEDDILTPTVTFIGGSAYATDLGPISLPPGLPDMLRSEISGIFNIGIEAGASVGTQDLKFYDLILIPIDEATFLAEANNPDGTNNQIGWWVTTDFGGSGVTTELEVDSIRNLRSGPRAMLKIAYTDEIFARWRLTSGAQIGCHANSDQRWWFLFGGGTQGATAFAAEPEITMRVSMRRAARYFSMRGDR